MKGRRTTTARQQTGDAQIDAIQADLRKVVATLNNAPIIYGRFLAEEKGAPAGSGLAFTSGVSRSIAHGLGRRARGFIECYGADLPSAAHVGLRATAHPTGVSSDTHVTVTPAASGTCCLYVF